MPGNREPDQGSVGYVVVLALVAALGGLLFGYDTAVISGAIGFLEKRFDLDELMKGWALSCALIGCIIGACLVGTLSDRLGRKKAMFLAAALFGLSALCSAFPRNLTELVIARILGGIGVGMASVLSPLYIAEVSPARMRGRLVSVNQLAIVSGILVAYFINALIARPGDEAWNVALGWRWMFAAEMLPAGVFAGLLFFVPESPRWLTQKGYVGRAQAILTRVNGRTQAARELDQIQKAIACESGSIRQLLLPGMRIPLMIGVALAILQQVTGINTVIYYAPVIFESTGRAATDALNATVIVGIINVSFTLVAIWMVDKLGRKPILLIGSVGMGISMALLGVAFGLKRFEGPWVLGCVLAYVAFFAVGMGPVVWVLIAEIFPTRIRGRAMSIATVCLWIACYGVSQLFPIMLKQLGGKAFFIYAVMCVVSFVFVRRWVPETRGKSLEEIEMGWIGRTSASPGVTDE